ncbi:MAG TPA: response regulator transcription factor [Sediminibacterium sp.]|nr:response regulator transcription factor [Sediminibacterium sp.]
MLFSVAIADDHTLFRRAITDIINQFDHYRVTIEAAHGKSLLEQIDPQQPPDLVLLDIGMPVMNGFETAGCLRANYPGTKIMALSMQQEDLFIVRMLRCGARGYLLKDSDVDELEKGMDCVIQKGFYLNPILYRNLVCSLQEPNTDTAVHENRTLATLTANEKAFLREVCQDKPYKKIASDMHMSLRTIDRYRDTLFEKLQVNSRTGLVLFAFRNQLVTL